MEDGRGRSSPCGRPRREKRSLPSSILSVLLRQMQLAALCYILHEGRLLLIRKKRGPGAGKINGPGGKADPGESMLDAAVRETQEEVGVTPRDLEQRGELVFDFGGDKVWRCGIFLARGHEGEPRETDEAIPFWCPVDALPYDEMWADDREWMPHFLAGRRFRGRVTVAPGDLVHEQVIEVEGNREDGRWRMTADE